MTGTTIGEAILAAGCCITTGFLQLRFFEKPVIRKALVLFKLDAQQAVLHRRAKTMIVIGVAILVAGLGKALVDLM